MIGERNVADITPAVVAIERAPAAIAILHAKQPLYATANRGFHALRVGDFHLLQGHQYKRSVIHVRIMIIAKFECPAAWFGVFIFYLPIARAKNLLG